MELPAYKLHLNCRTVSGLDPPLQPQLTPSESGESGESRDVAQELAEGSRQGWRAVPPCWQREGGATGCQGTGARAKTLRISFLNFHI